MKIAAFRGFVLKTVNLSTSRQILVAYTQHGGKRQGIFRISKKHPRAYLTPLTLLQFQLRGKEQQSLPAVIEPSLERHCFDFAGDYLGLTLLHHWASLVDASQAELQEDERVFRLLDHCQQHLDLTQKEKLPLQNLYFETWLLHFAGILPKPTHSEPPETATVPSSKRKDLEQHYLAFDPAILMRVFQQNIEDFASISLQCDPLTAAMQQLEGMWHHFLGHPIKTHASLQNRFKERGLL